MGFFNGTNSWQTVGATPTISTGFDAQRSACMLQLERWGQCSKEVLKTKP
jgi:hypothetical protein